MRESPSKILNTCALAERMLPAVIVFKRLRRNLPKRNDLPVSPSTFLNQWRDLSAENRVVALCDREGNARQTAAWAQSGHLLVPQDGMGSCCIKDVVEDKQVPVRIAFRDPVRQLIIRLCNNMCFKAIAHSLPYSILHVG